MYDSSRFCSKYKFLFAAYLSISVLIFGVHKMSQTLGFAFLKYFWNILKYYANIYEGELFFFLGNNNSWES